MSTSRQGLILYLPAQVAQGVAGLLALVLFTRLLSPAEYGIYALGVSATGLAYTAIFTWGEAAMARFHTRAEEEGTTPDHLATLYGAWALAAAVFFVLAAILLAVLPLSVVMKTVFGAGLGVIAFRGLARLAQERRRARGEVAGATLLAVVQSVGALAFGVGFALVGMGGASPLLGMAVAAAIGLTWALPSDLAGVRGGRFSPVLARAYLAYGLPLAASLSLSLIIATTDRFLLAGLLGETAVGVFHAGYGLAGRSLEVIFIGLGAAGGPVLAMALERGGRPALEAAAKRQAEVMILLALPAAAGLALLARPLAEVVIGPQLSEGAGAVTPWIAVAAALSGFTTYYLAQAFILGQRPGLLLAAIAIPAVCNLGLNLVLIPQLGVQGATLATAASYALGMVTTWVLGRRVLPLPLPWGALARCGLATGIMAVVLLRLPSAGGWPELLLKAGLGALVYGAAAFVLDAGGARDRAARLLSGGRRA